MASTNIQVSGGAISVNQNLADSWAKPVDVEERGLSVQVIEGITGIYK